MLGEAQAAREALEHSIALNPNDPSPHYQLARVLAQLNQRAAADQEMQRFIELNKVQQSKGGMATGRQQ